MSKTTQPPQNPLAGLDGQLMVMAAHRYCLGRRSYIVGSCIDWLTIHWSTFEPNTQFTIIRDTIEALQDDMAGEPMDMQGWRRFATRHFPTLSESSQTIIRQIANARDKDWPLDPPAT